MVKERVLLKRDIQKRKKIQKGLMWMAYFHNKLTLEISVQGDLDSGV